MQGFETQRGDSDEKFVPMDAADRDSGDCVGNDCDRVCILSGVAVLARLRQNPSGYWPDGHRGNRARHGKCSPYLWYE